MTKLDEKLIGITSVGISGHVRPDGDCVGSTLAVYNYIKEYYPNIDADIYLETIPDVFYLFKNTYKIIYKCKKCKHTHKNIMALDDDFETIINITKKKGDNL